MDRYIPISKIFSIGSSILQRKIPFILEKETYLSIIFSDKIRNDSYVLCIELYRGWYTSLSLEGENSVTWHVFSSDKGKEYFVDLFNNDVVYTGYDVSVMKRVDKDIFHPSFEHCLKVLGEENRELHVMAKMRFAKSIVYYFESEGARYGFIVGEKESYFAGEKPPTYEQRILYAYLMSKLGR